MKYDRSHWIRALTSISESKLKSAIASLSEPFAVKHTAIPQSGISILRMTETALGEPYYLGEIPIAFARVSLTTSTGESYEGAAQVMDENEDLATVLAVADAVLANKLSRWEVLENMVAQGMQQLEKTAQLRQQMLISTKVDFSDFFTGSEQSTDTPTDEVVSQRSR